MNHSRPKNLNLFTIRFPLPAIVSILHRVSGAALFLLLPFLLWAFNLSLTEPGFEAMQQTFAEGWVKCVIWIIFVPFCYHLVAGIRHLLSDIRIGSSLKGGKIGAALTFVVSAVLIILAGWWLW